MTTEKFNKLRSKEWLKIFNKDESRLFMMVGIKQNGSYSFMADPSQTPQKIAQELEELAKSIRMQYQTN